MEKATSIGLLSFDQAAEELQTTVLAVKRVVARGRIKAHRLGESGDWRVKAEDLTAYVAAGATDLDPPKLTGRWLDQGPARSAVEFVEAVAEASENQIPEQAPEASPGGVRRVELQLSPAILEVVQKPVPRLFKDSFAPEFPFRDWRELYLVDRIRALTRKLVEPPKDMTSGEPLGKLYGDVEAYKRLTSEASEELLSRGVSFSRSYWIASNGGGMWENVQFRLPIKLLAPAGSGVIERVVELAF